MRLQTSWLSWHVLLMRHICSCPDNETHWLLSGPDQTAELTLMHEDIETK